MARLAQTVLRENVWSVWWDPSEPVPVFHDTEGVHANTRRTWLPWTDRFDLEDTFLNELAAEHNREPRTRGFCEWCVVQRKPERAVCYTGPTSPTRTGRTEGR